MGKWVSYLKREKKLDSLVGRRPTAPPAPKGLYIYGNVGSGIYLLVLFFFWIVMVTYNVNLYQDDLISKYELWTLRHTLHLVITLGYN